MEQQCVSVNTKFRVLPYRLISDSQSIGTGKAIYGHSTLCLNPPGDNTVNYYWTTPANQYFFSCGVSVALLSE